MPSAFLAGARAVRLPPVVAPRLRRAPRRICAANIPAPKLPATPEAPAVRKAVTTLAGAVSGAAAVALLVAPAQTAAVILAAEATGQVAAILRFTGAALIATAFASFAALAEEAPKKMRMRVAGLCSSVGAGLFATAMLAFRDGVLTAQGAGWALPIGGLLLLAHVPTILLDA